ncbi:MAG: TIGR02757 family protein [Proteobacteria bacterium]|nr:TIGR02757 family protein [Pseudomonadota bacterium]MCP4917963.1 TIGR02757 family protein [Pseudomonadota bacterium]
MLGVRGEAPGFPLPPRLGHGLAPLQAGLERLYRDCDFAARLATDPVRFPRRYTDPLDQELAGFLAGGFAFGRVDLFGPVLERLCDHMDVAGGPRAFVEGFEAQDLTSFQYRWIKGPALNALFANLRQVLDERGSLGAIAEEAFDGSLASSIEALAEAIDVPGAGRGVHTFASRPSKGSACKRWCMVVRWMVRPDTEGIDLGIWDLPASALVVPLDTHVARIGRLIGLTTRSTNGWRTAQDMTASLAACDADDPVRYDFALAHLGIAGLCVGEKHPVLCPACSLRSVCTVQ